MKRCLINIFICIVYIIPNYAQEWVNICPSFIPDDIYGLDGVFINKYEGWIIGIGELPQKLYRTIDGGKTWEIQMSRDSIFYSNLSFINDEYGWMKISKWIGPYSDYENYLFKTNDGGKTWGQVSNPPDSAFYAITFIDSLTGYSGGQNAISITKDGGKTWSEQYIDREVEVILSGDIVYYDASFTLVDLFFIDKEYGWAVGNRNDVTDCGIILNTIDGGKSWQIQLPETLIMEAVYFSNSLHGCAVGSNVYWEGVVMVTEDGGESWQDMYLPCFWLNDVVFTDDNTGWVVGDYGFILYTENGGQTWTQVESGTDSDLNRIVFVDDGNIGYIFGEDNTLLKYDKNGNSIGDYFSVPDQFNLSQNYPNPFNAATTIEYILSQNSNVRLSIYDINGCLLETLVEQYQANGNYQVKWNADKYSSCVYFYQFQVDGYLQTKKMLLIK